MVFKTNKKIKQEMEVFFRFRMECLNRHADYVKDYQKMVLLADEMDRLANDITEGVEYDDYSLEEIEEDYDDIALDYSNLLKKYNLRHPPPRPNDPNGWKVLQESNNAVVIKSDDPRWITDSRVYSLDGTKDFESFKIDIWRDKRETLRELSSWIDKVRQWRKKKDQKQGRAGKIQIAKADRYFAVYDLRNQKPPMPYDKIVLKLLDAYFQGKSLDEAVAIAKHDFRRIFKAIYGVAGKEISNNSSFKGCQECPNRDGCKELCADAMYELSRIEVKQMHRMGKMDISEWHNI